MICKIRKTILPLITASLFRYRASLSICKTPYTASQQIQQIRNRLDGNNVGEAATSPNQQVLLQAQQALLNAQIDQQRRVLRKYSLRDTLQRKQRDYVTASIALNISFNFYGRRSAMETYANGKTAGEAHSPDEAAARIEGKPLVKQELDINHQLSQHLIVATETAIC